MTSVQSVYAHLIDSSGLDRWRRDSNAATATSFPSHIQYTYTLFPFFFFLIKKGWQIVQPRHARLLCSSSAAIAATDLEGEVSEDGGGLLVTINSRLGYYPALYIQYRMGGDSVVNPAQMTGADGTQIMKSIQQPFSENTFFFSLSKHMLALWANPCC